MKLIKVIIYKVYVILLMIFVVWTAQFLYPVIFGFDEGNLLNRSLHYLDGNESDEVKMVKIKSNMENSKKTTELDLGYKVIKQQYIDKHFHHIGFEIQDDKTNACVYCHGQVPHEKDPESRSFLNMHAFTVACESCHSIATEGKNNWGFAWYSIKTGNIVSNPTMLVEEDIFRGPFGDKNKKYYPTGNYGAKIAPGYQVNDEFRLLTNRADLEAAKDYMQTRHELTQTQRKKRRKDLHRVVNKKPLECDNCHGDTHNYIGYDKLGYPPRRVRQLNDTAIVGLISKYERFYFPNFMEGSGRRK